MSTITIYHNPRCSNSRTTLALIRSQGVEPEVIEYLRHPPSRETLLALVAATGRPVIGLVRRKEAVFTALQLEPPVLINRPIVVSPRGARLCRPPEQVLDLLPPPTPSA